MLSIGKITEDIINRSPFLREAMTENLVNISALARKIKPEIEELYGSGLAHGVFLSRTTGCPQGIGQAGVPCARRAQSVVRNRPMKGSRRLVNAGAGGWNPRQAAERKFRSPSQISTSAARPIAHNARKT